MRGKGLMALRENNSWEILVLRQKIRKIFQEIGKSEFLRHLVMGKLLITTNFYYWSKSKANFLANYCIFFSLSWREILKNWSKAQGCQMSILFGDFRKKSIFRPLAPKPFGSPNWEPGAEWNFLSRI